MTSKIVFKCDNLEGLSDNVLTFDKIVSETGIKVSWGIIGRFLKNASDRYIAWVQEKNNSGNYEFFNHGFYHGKPYGKGFKDHSDYQYEFLKPSILQQYHFIKKTQKLARKKFGIKLRCFGTPANRLSIKTAIALFFFRQIKAWFYGIKFDKYIFKRSVEIEFPCGHVDFEKFKNAYIQTGKKNDLITYQLHPNMWKESDFSEFKKVIYFLKSENVQFLLPRDIYSSTRHKDKNHKKNSASKSYKQKDIQMINQNIMQHIQQITNCAMETYWSNVYHDTIINSSWLKNKSVSPGRWAVSYVVLYVLYRILDEIKPATILECGLGQSSKLTIQYTDAHKADLTICENNAEWLSFFQKQFPTANKYTTILKTEMIHIAEHEALTYAGFKKTLGKKKFNLVLIDGPFGSQHYSRPEILDVVDNLDKSFVILLDDMNRLGERETWSMLKTKLDERHIQFAEKIYSSDKQLGLICSPDLEYLTTL